MCESPAFPEISKSDTTCYEVSRRWSEEPRGYPESLVSAQVFVNRFCFNLKNTAKCWLPNNKDVPSNWNDEKDFSLGSLGVVLQNTPYIRSLELWIDISEYTYVNQENFRTALTSVNFELLRQKSDFSRPSLRLLGNLRIFTEQLPWVKFWVFDDKLRRVRTVQKFQYKTLNLSLNSIQ